MIKKQILHITKKDKSDCPMADPGFLSGLFALKTALRFDSIIVSTLLLL